MEGEKLTVDQFRRIIANPFYCINIHPSMCDLHEPIVTEEMWVKAGVESIKENGAEMFLKNLLENLKGNYV